MSNAPTLNQFKLHRKQEEAFLALKDPSVLTVVYGGAMGGGKSVLIAAFVLWAAFTYPDTKYLICRKVYADLIATTLESLWRVARSMGIEQTLRAGYNQQRKVIELPNGSKILLRQVDPKGDETFQEIGSLELSFAAVDESGETERLVYQTLLTRLRYNCPPFGPKILLCSNPSRNYVFDFFDQWEKGTLPKNIRYIPCTQFENPFLDERFRATLVRENFDEFIWESQILGNWRYERGDRDCFTISDIANAFDWSPEGVDLKGKFLTWDPAYGGGDRSVVMLWQGMSMERVWVWRKRDASAQVEDVRRIISENQVPARNVSIDGIGSAALVSQFRGCFDYRANARPLDGAGYATLKDQLYFRLSEAIAKGEIRFRCPEIREELAEELIAHKSYRTDTDQNAAILPKSQVARIIGRSPDLSDCVSQRMLFLLRRKEFRVDVVRF